MAGCFGNHPFDRAMEQSLYRHLAWEADYESLCEEMCKNIPDDLWDKYDDLINKLIDKYLGVRVERGITTMKEAQNILLRYAMIVDANNKYNKRG